MDYDDNDYQNQHIQLGGEDNNNFLRPFSLPKFDLDEHLQAQLRFDNLDDSEDILGIGVQEGSQWIQDFTAGTRGIEFNSGGAESCSIPRQKNIWYEATSTESVEMLLKSVGEDDMLTNRITINPAEVVLNNTNDDSNTTMHRNVETAVNVNSSPMSTCKSPEKKISMPIVDSHATAVCHQSPEDVNFGERDFKDLGESFTNDEDISIRHCDPCMHTIPLPGKSPEDVTPNTSALDGISQERLSEDCGAPVTYLESKLPGDLGDCLSEKGRHMMHLSSLEIDFDNPLSIAIVDGVVSVDAGSQKPSNDFRTTYGGDSQSQASDELALSRLEHNLLQTGSEIGDCHGDVHVPVVSYNPSKLSSRSEAEDMSADAIKACKDPVQPKSSDGLLEVLVDEVQFSDKDGDDLASQVEQQQVLLASSEINRSDGHVFVSSCITGEDHSDLRSQGASPGMIDACNESVHSMEPDDLLDVIVGGMRFPNNNSKVGEFKDDTFEKNKETTHVIFSPTKVEATDKTDLCESSFELDHCVEIETPSMTPEKEHLGKHLKESDKKLETSDDISFEISCATNKIEKVQASISVGTTQVGSCAQMPDYTVRTALEVRNTSSFLEPMVNDYVTNHGEASSSPDSDNLAGTDLLSYGKLDSLEISHTPVPQETIKVTINSPQAETDSEVCADSDTADPMHSYTVIEGRTNSVSQASDAISACIQGSLHEKLMDEAKPDVVPECIKTSEIVEVFTKLKDIEQSSDVAGNSDNKTQNGSGTQTPNSDSNSDDQDVSKFCGESQDHDMVANEEITQILPNKDVDSKNESLDYVDDTKIHCKEIVSKASSEHVGLVINSDASMRDGSASKPSSLRNTNNPSCAFGLVEDSQAEVVKKDIDEEPSVQTCSVSCNATTAGASCAHAKVSIENSKVSAATPEDASFSFSAGGDLPEKDVIVEEKPFLDSESSKSEAEEVSLAPGIEKCDSKLSTIESHEEKRALVNEMQIHDSSAKGTSKDTSKSVVSLSSSKRKSAKDPQVAKKATDRSKKNSVSSSLEDMPQHISLEECSAKPSCSTVFQPSNLPDLNTAASGASLFNQPFTDAQQVQLRAQILVYGYLIQGIPPEEACMVSAFGDSDGGRITWGGVWHAFSEKYRSQKSPILRTPHSANKSQDQASTHLRVNTPACQTGSKSSVLFSSSPSLHSPIWNLPPQDVPHSNIARGSLVDSSRILSPLHAYHSPHVRQFAPGGAPWLGRSPVSMPLLPVNQSSMFGMNAQVSTLRPGELSHTKEFSTPNVSTSQFLPPGTFPSVGATMTVSTIPALQTDEVSLSPNKQGSCESKSRKKKKGNESDMLKQMLIVSKPQLEPLVTSGSSKPLGFSMSINASNKVSSDIVIPSVCPTTSPTHFQVLDTGSTDRIIISAETCTNVELARKQAEEAAAFASAAVRHSESLWNQLSFQRNSGLIPEVEHTLSSSAVAVAAAASVARAAAAAAKVAADAALQAKLITDDALAANKVVRAPTGFEVGLSKRENNIVNSIPDPVSKHNEVTSGSCSVISVARECARRRVEAASAAAKRAENLDAIVKAAELAASAVAQAGAIVAMGDPLPFTLNDILDAGPGNYWKANQSKAGKLVTLNVDSVNGIVNDNANSQAGSAIPNNLLVDRRELSQSESTLPLYDSIGHRVRECTDGVSGVASIVSPDDGLSKEKLAVNNNDQIIREGSIVEVSSDENGVGCIWYSARVLDIKDGKAHVCYNTLLANEGSEKLKAWVVLKDEGNRAPRIRVAPPSTATKCEGNRKRRRDVAVTHIWNVGDKVDAWIKDGWWEGVITGKSSAPDNKLTVCLSDGNSSIVRSWDLRPSLVWENGEWVEWSLLKVKGVLSNEGDTPKEKRQKISGSGVKNLLESQSSDINKFPKSGVSSDLIESDAHATLSLSSKEHIFSIGKSTSGENSPGKVKRTAMQKQGPGVIFGVPRPGKKRKFMDVSKQCVVDNREKVKEGHGSMKFAKYLMPQPSHGWKTVQKIDQKDKRAADLKSRTVKSKSQNIATRKASDKCGSSTSASVVSAEGDNSRGPLSVDLSAGNKLEKNIHLEVSLSNSMRGADEHMLVHQLQSTPGVSSGNQLTSDAEAETADKEKNPSTVERDVRRNDKSLILVDHSGKASGGNEPRRSNRRIQPTSRMLEGLQSSLMISKIPSSSHEKASKTAPRGGLATRGRILRSHG